MPYSVHRTLLAESDKIDISRRTLQDVLQKALPKRLRRHHRVERLLDDLDNHSEASITWNVQRRIQERDDHWATLNIWVTSAERDENAATYAAQLLGPSAHLVLERLNVEYRQQKRSRKSSHRRKLSAAQKRTRRKARNRERRLERQRELAAGIRKRSVKRRRVQATMSHRLHDVTPQFKKTRIFFEEAVDMIIFACQPLPESQRTVRQSVMYQLYRSLEHTGGAFARIKCGEFSIALTIEGGRWRGVGLTPVRVWSEETTRSPAYRRLRKWMNQKRCIPQAEASVRHQHLFSPVDRLAA